MIELRPIVFPDKEYEVYSVFMSKKSNEALVDDEVIENIDIFEKEGPTVGLKEMLKDF